MEELYKMVVMDVYNERRGGPENKRKEIIAQIQSLTEKLSNAREMLFDEKIEHTDFSLMKRECEEKIKRLEAKLSELKVQKK